MIPIMTNTTNDNERKIGTMLYTITKNGVWLDNSDTVIQTRQLIWWCFKTPALISQNPL